MAVMDCNQKAVQKPMVNIIINFAVTNNLNGQKQDLCLSRPSLCIFCWDNYNIPVHKNNLHEAVKGKI
ncbi:hypothetical protein DCCM_3301 [Desulfocucumis palustris]|uniref:Uncharacterized protein n=1 Tax=Desulfocucumis palustris TaxID=1898651 RepID=A0A2L2XCX1_9FIRM|nr:hypothetical protein DCCM_3301 [Desulfocucumis palustris]